jgi:hypothetical protein
MLHSLVVVPVVSMDALERFYALAPDSPVDNVLLEWTLAVPRCCCCCSSPDSDACQVELGKLGLASVLPLLVGPLDQSGRVTPLPRPPQRPSLAHSSRFSNSTKRVCPSSSPRWSLEAWSRRSVPCVLPLTFLRRQVRSFMQEQQLPPSAGLESRTVGDTFAALLEVSLLSSSSSFAR